MHTRILATLALAGAFVLAGGCATVSGTPELDLPKYTMEDTGSFEVLDKPTLVSVGCTGLQESRLPDGRIEVTANIKNRENRRIQVQVNCVFKDANGFSTGDEAPFQTIILTENSTKAVTFAAMNNKAVKYTIGVRQAR